MKLNISKNPADIEKIIEVVKSFGGTPEHLIEIREYVAKEAQEFGSNRILFYYLDKDHEACAVVQLILNNADNRPDLADGKSIAHVHALQVSKFLHRQGVGMRLMEEVEDYARKMPLSRLTLGVDGDNKKAQSLYKKLSYSLLEKVEGRDPEVPLLYMFKDL